MIPGAILPLAEYDGGGVVLRRYVHGPGQDDPLLWYEGSGLTDKRWFHGDERGSILATSSSAATATLYRYGPYGEPSHWTGSRFRYTGQIMLPEVQLYHSKARVYDPKIGRFLQTDPVGYKDDLNLYAYVGNDPLNRTDPSGQSCTKVGNGKYSCRVDSMVDKKGNITERKNFAAKQIKQVAAFEKSYTTAVNKLASNASAKVTVSVPGGKSETTTAGYVARAAANRVVEAAPSVKNTTAGAATHGDGMGGIVTTVNARGLAGKPALPGVANSDAMRQLVITHEAMHGGYIDNTRGRLGIDEFNKAHQGPYNEAAIGLLGDDD